MGYIPRERVVGLSKIPRLVDAVARRLQIQERLTKQIADIFEGVVQPLGVGVVVVAEHLCVGCRGIKARNTVMITSSLGGVFRTEQSVREEFLSFINVKGGVL